MQRVLGGVLRRLSAESPDQHQQQQKVSPSPSSSNLASAAMPSDFLPLPSSISYTPPRTASPYSPPPLTPLTLKASNTPSPVLARTLAEEIRLLVPTRLEVIDTWHLVYSLERDGASLSTLYARTTDYHENGKRGGFVLVVKDGSGNVFGAYLNETPRPSNGHYYGNGECFLWRCTVLAPLGGSASSASLVRMGLPVPPSEDTTNAVRMTTLGGDMKKTHAGRLVGEGAGNGAMTPTSMGGRSGTSTPGNIRFKAFPYSGMNDYMIFCEQTFLSIGGGDGHYGLWIDASLENGISDSCPTFGNEPLSDDGKKFDVLGVEVWYIGS